MKKTGLFHRSARGALAIRPSALSIYWAYGCGDENATIGNATVVNIQGPLEQRSCWYDGYDAIVERFRLALKEDTSTVILRIDSPGGECAGCFDAVEKMRALAADSDKRIIAYADESAYSAAYAMACVADEIYLPRAGGVGSVGVIAVVADQVGLNERIGINVAVIFSGDHKADCHPDIPLSDDALAGVQHDVDILAEMFRELVSGSRNVSTDAITALEAATFMGEEGVEAGLADGVMTFDELIGMLDDGSGTTEAATGTSTVTTNEESPMNKGKKAKTTNADGGDLMSVAQVAVADPAAFAAISASLRQKVVGVAVAAAKSDDDSTTTSTTTTTEEVEADGTTTTTTESEETVVTPGADDEGDDGDDEEDDEDEEDAPPSSKGARATLPAPAAAAPSKGKRATSGDVLALVRELTGSASSAEQIGALTALRDRAASADAIGKDARKAARIAAKRELRTTVDKAISTGRLAPSQREWAMSVGLATVKGYLRAAPAPLVKRMPTAHGKVADMTTPTGMPSTGDPAVDAAVAEIAAKCMLDPKAIAEHAKMLKNAGVILQ